MRDKEEKPLITSHVYYKGLLDKKRKIFCLHDINFIFSRNGLTTFAAFLLLLFVRVQDKPASDVGCRSTPARLNFHSKKFRLEVKEK